MAEIAFEINGVTKSFFGINALKNVSFILEKGKTLGLIGENGAGKSTMMNIIGGVLQPDEGEMRLFGAEYRPQKPKDAIDNQIAFVHQELNLFPNLSIMDNMFIEGYPGRTFIDRAKMRSVTRELLKNVELDISPDMLLEKLSPGQRQLVEIAKCLRSNPNIIIFDEPTTSLTSNEAERLFAIIAKLKQSGRTIVYISHNLNEIKRLSDNIVVLRDGQVTDKGPAKDFDINRMIKSMVGRDITQLYPERRSKPEDKVVLEARGISEYGIVHDVSFTLKKGEILGIFGLMGSGRTELLRILFGLDAYHDGELYINGERVQKGSPVKSIRQKIGFVSENRKEEGLLLEQSVEENLSLVSLPSYSRTIFKMVDAKGQKQPMKEMVGKLKIKVNSIEKQKAKSLSGGNQQKIVIAKWLMENPKILLVDEPTRGIDVGAKYEVYSILNNLAADGTSILMVSSEIEELMGVCDRILVMSRGEICGEFHSGEFESHRILAAAFRKNEYEVKEC